MESDETIIILFENIVIKEDEESLRELIFAYKSEDEEPSVSRKAFSCLLDLVNRPISKSLKDQATEAINKYGNPENRFSVKVKNPGWLLSKRNWKPSEYFPDLTPVPAGLCIIGSKEKTPLSIMKFKGGDGKYLDLVEYTSEDVTRRYLETGVNLVDSYQDERPEHYLFIDAFSIGIACVTNLQYSRFIKETGHETPPHWQNGELLLDQYDFPVVNVSWFDAMQFCKWLTKKLRLERKIQENEEIRLPTEVEWEKAARGPDGRLFPWGNKFREDLCNFRISKFGHPTPTGYYSSHADSYYGCKDMAGNVWEWTLSIWGNSGRKPQYSYPYNATDGRENVGIIGKRRVIRGGAFYYYYDCLRCSVRNRNYPTFKHPAGSFRILVKKMEIESVSIPGVTLDI